jgi:cell division transport system ATP-binding protein
VGSEALIQLLHVTKRYDAEVPALSDVTLEISKGEFVFLTGPSGAGKSTLLKLLLCAEPPSSGQVMVFGRNVAKIRASRVPYLRRNIGVVFQDFKLLPDRTVAENVAFPLEVRAISQREVRRRVSVILRSLGLDGKERKFPPSLSGGEQQRVAVARALVGDPALLLADEPTGNLDADRAQDVMQLLHAANARGTTVVVATHDRFMLERHRKRVVALEGGKVVSDADASRRTAGGLT